MRFVALKTKEQQASLMLHRTRQMLVRQRTMLSNAMRGHLTELGIVSAKTRKSSPGRRPHVTQRGPCPRTGMLAPDRQA
jgi:transposase